MKVLIAIEAGDVGERVLKAVGPWAVASGTELHLLTVLDQHDVHETVRPHATHAMTPAGTQMGTLLNTREPYVEQAENRSQAIEAGLQELQGRQRSLVAAIMPSATCVFHAQIESDVPRAIIDCAKELGVDFIAMGTHGRTGLSHLVMGSVAENVVRKATVPVLVVGPQAMPPAG